MFDSLKIPNVSDLFFEKGVPKKHKSFMFLKSCYFVMGGPIDMNFGVF